MPAVTPWNSMRAQLMDQIDDGIANQTDIHIANTVQWEIFEPIGDMQWPERFLIKTMVEEALSHV